LMTSSPKLHFSAKQDKTFAVVYYYLPSYKNILLMMIAFLLSLHKGLHVMLVHNN
jgi:hypothetical protein